MDVIVCATGFDTSFHYPFDIIGREGKLLRDRFTPHAEAYLSVAVDNFPNLFIASGPNSSINSGSFLNVLESVVNYSCQLILKLQRDRYKSMEPKAEAIKELAEYSRRFFKKVI